MDFKRLLKDLGVEDLNLIEIKSDASAAVGIGSRIGIGKVRHIEVNQLWLQEKVAAKKFKIIKVPTADNLADALTKGVDASVLQNHVAGINAEMLRDRHSIAPK